MGYQSGLIAYTVAGAVSCASVLLTWWNGESGLGAPSAWPKAAFGAGVLAIVVASRVRPREHPKAALLAAPIVLAASLIAFYATVGNSEFFAEMPFTHHVGTGFVVAVVALQALVGLSLVIATDTDRPSRGRAIRRSLLALVVVMVLTMIGGSAYIG